jgi:hypothetical protein
MAPAKADVDEAVHDLRDLDDVLSLSAIAYRGLWDKFAQPRSADAIQRSYSRGVPSLIECADGSAVSDALAVVTNQAVNRRQRPAYLVIDALPWVAIPRLPSNGPIAVLAIDRSGPTDRTSRIYRWAGGAWLTVGSYIPLSAVRRGLTLDARRNESDLNSVAVFESTNVVNDVLLSPTVDGLDDDAVYASVRSVVGATAEIFRVSDLVELDWLQQRIREAA